MVEDNYYYDKEGFAAPPLDQHSVVNVLGSYNRKHIPRYAISEFAK